MRKVRYITTKTTPSDVSDQGFDNLEVAWSAFKNRRAETKAHGFPASVSLKSVVITDGEITGGGRLAIFHNIQSDDSGEWYCPHTFYQKPDPDCDDCDYNVAASGDRAAACPDCCTYGDTG